jgi:hypothetical protein
MDAIFLNIKFLLFSALELSVLFVMGAALLAGAYQIVRDQVREARRRDQIAPKAT